MGVREGRFGNREESWKCIDVSPKEGGGLSLR